MRRATSIRCFDIDRPRSEGVRWWTRTQSIRTAGALPFEVALFETAERPVYQRIARKALQLRELGTSDRTIAGRLGFRPHFPFLGPITRRYAKQGCEGIRPHPGREPRGDRRVGEGTLAIEPQPAIYSDLGFVLDRQGLTEEASELYRKALDLDPGSASAHYNLATSLARDGEFTAAERHLRAALAQEPNARAYTGLGFVLSSPRSHPAQRRRPPGARPGPDAPRTHRRGSQGNGDDDGVGREPGRGALGNRRLADLTDHESGAEFSHRALRSRGRPRKLCWEGRHVQALPEGPGGHQRTAGPAGLPDQERPGAGVSLAFAASSQRHALGLVCRRRPTRRRPVAPEGRSLPRTRGRVCQVVPRARHFPLAGDLRPDPRPARDDQSRSASSRRERHQDLRGASRELPPDAQAPEAGRRPDRKPPPKRLRTRREAPLGAAAHRRNGRGRRGSVPGPRDGGYPTHLRGSLGGGRQRGAPRCRGALP
ncbi:MAG: tetratricopeptide repeat protein [Myxococcales bacterium]|nr:MAG: tetratricopeptide repeat protein [Myxococcales bacterium]